MAPSSYTQYVLHERPEAHVTPTTFEKQEVAYEKPGEKQVLVQVQYLSIDPAMRGWLSRPLYTSTMYSLTNKAFE